MDFKKKMKKFFTMTRKAEGGFTLVELIVVIAILAILAGVTVPSYGNYVEKAQMAADQQTLATMNTAFTVACMDNGEYDMTNLSFSPVASNIQTKVEVNKYNTEFLTYFGEGAFKYYDDITFVRTEGVFKGSNDGTTLKNANEVWNTVPHNFKGDEEELLDIFDDIGDTFANMSGQEYDLDYALSNFSDTLENATGLKGIFGELYGAMNLSDEQLHEYLMSDPDYAAAADKEAWIAANTDKVATVKGNAAVLHFANSAATANSNKVQNDVSNFMTLLEKSTDPTWQAANMSTEYQEAYYLSTLDEAGRTAYENISDPADKLAALNSFLYSKNSVGMMGIEAAAWAKAAEQTGMTNTSGVSTLGAIYALSAGYYESTGKTPAHSLGTFDAFVDAAREDPAGFLNYYDSHGAADVDAYLAFMGAMSAGNVTMTDPNAFAGQLGFITDALK